MFTYLQTGGYSETWLRPGLSSANLSCFYPKVGGDLVTVDLLQFNADLSIIDGAVIKEVEGSEHLINIHAISPDQVYFQISSPPG